MSSDILTDLASVLQGGMGVAPSGNIGDKQAMFEPVHGSAPKYPESNLANPIGAILSAKIMLEYLGEKYSDPRLVDASKGIEDALIRTFKKGIFTKDMGGSARCSEVCSAASKYVSSD